jgi:hypothetical protein
MRICLPLKREGKQLGMTASRLENRLVAGCDFNVTGFFEQLCLPMPASPSGSIISAPPGAKARARAGREKQLVIPRRVEREPGMTNSIQYSQFR